MARSNRNRSTTEPAPPAHAADSHSQSLPARADEAPPPATEVPDPTVTEQAPVASGAEVLPDAPHDVPVASDAIVTTDSPVIIEGLTANPGVSVVTPSGDEAVIPLVQEIKPAPEVVVVDPVPAPAVEAPRPPDIDAVFTDLTRRLDQPPVLGYRSNRPDVRLTQCQAEMQARIFDSLTRLGTPIQKQGDVYAWLLDQVAVTLKEIAPRPN